MICSTSFWVTVALMQQNKHTLVITCTAAQTDKVLLDTFSSYMMSDHTLAHKIEFLPRILGIKCSLFNKFVFLFL